MVLSEDSIGNLNERNGVDKFRGFYDLNDDPGGNMKVQALLRRTSKKNSLMASQGSVRSSTTGEKINYGNLNTMCVFVSLRNLLHIMQYERPIIIHQL